MQDTAMAPRKSDGRPPGRPPLVDEQMAGLRGLVGVHLRVTCGPMGGLSIRLTGRSRCRPVGQAMEGLRSGVPPDPGHRLDLRPGRAPGPQAPGMSLEGGHQRCGHCFHLVVSSVVGLDGDDVGAAAPAQGRRDDGAPAVLPGADEVLKVGGGPGLLQVLEGGVEPAQESAPVGGQQVGGGGRAAVRVAHHLFGVVEVPLNVGAVGLDQVDELGLGDKRRRRAGPQGGPPGREDAAHGVAESSHGACLR